MRSSSKVAISSISVVALIAAGVLAWLAYAPVDDSRSLNRKAEGNKSEVSEVVVLGSGLDRVASKSANDWARNADLVAVATVDSETAMGVPAAENEGLVGRTVTIRIEDTVWTRLNPKSVPETLSLNAIGWVFNRGKYQGKREFAFENQPRLEVGHRYVMALAQRPAVTREMVEACGGGDPTKPEHWETIGEFGVVPYDGQTLGAGEFEGTERTRAQASNAAEKAKSQTGDQASFRDQVTGDGVDSVRGRMKALGDVQRAPSPTRPCLERGYEDAAKDDRVPSLEEEAEQSNPQ